MADNIKLEAEIFFKEYNKLKRRYLNLCGLREEKLGAIGYISYAVLFIGIMAMVAIRLYGITDAIIYIILGALTAAAAIYLIVNQVRIGIYEKKGRKKRDSEFEKVKSEYLKLQDKYDYYKALKKCGYDEKAYEEKIKAEKAEKEKERLEKAKEIAANKKFDDSVCVYCHGGICGFEGDQTVYSFKCDYSSCRWRTRK
ncbi:MAG: hypothetical protein J6K88_01820 [Oscillospiraceae bacterium]|nr:hypothetical protein [Oscillospiraceae bacterium]